MRYNLLILMVSLLLLSCIQTNQYKHFEQKQIVGQWILTKNQINYPIIVFNEDSTAIFQSLGDTVYRFTFVLRNDSLILEDINNAVTINKIKLLNDTNLIFYNLLEFNKKQVYIK